MRYFWKRVFIKGINQFQESSAGFIRFGKQLHSKGFIAIFAYERKIAFVNFFQPARNDNSESTSPAGYRVETWKCGFFFLNLESSAPIRFASDIYYLFNVTLEKGKTRNNKAAEKYAKYVE